MLSVIKLILLDNINYLLTQIDWIDRVMSHLALRRLKGILVILVHGAPLYKEPCLGLLSRDASLPKA